MDAVNALADLTEISTQIEEAVVLDNDGGVAASTCTGEHGSERLARAGRELLAAAEDGAWGARAPTQLEAALREGSVFVVRDGDRTIVATTSPAPASGLVLYDLRACLRAIAAAGQPKPKPRRRSTKKATSA